MVNVDLQYCDLGDLSIYQKRIDDIENSLVNKTCLGNDFLGWMTRPNDFDPKEIAKIKNAAQHIKDNCEVLLVVGIGGSYLGARAAIEMINGLYPKNQMEILYLGNTFSSTYIKQVLDYIKDKKFAINVISKSGTTTETSIAFRLLRKLAEEKYGDKAKDYIFATTDQNKGVLKSIADLAGYETFVIPDDIGGRFSVLTAVGLLPMACAGIDIEQVMQGASQAVKDCSQHSIDDNPAYQYALARHLLYKRGYAAEMFVTYDLQTTMFAEWWKQLFGESEGKEGVGLLPTSATFSTDLHSLGQFIQEGSNVLFETILAVKQPQLDIDIFKTESDDDQLNYLVGKSVDEVNKKAMEGTIEAHVVTGKVPNVIVHVDSLNAFSFGYLSYFFMKACAISVLMLDVNPFNQPGVEVYKRNMFKLLGKE